MDSSPKIDITYTRSGSEGQLMLATRFPDDTAYIDNIKITSAKAREKYGLAVVERAPAVSPKAVEAELDRIAAEVAAELLAQEAGPSGRDDASKEPDDLLSETPEPVLREAKELLKDPELIKHIVTDITAMGVAGELELTATIYLVGTSRLLRKPLASIVQGPSSSGKSFQVERVAAMFPEEATIHATQMTPQALFHMPEGSLVHKFVVAGERSRSQSPETAEATRALREIISSGRLSKLMPVKVEGGAIETCLIEQAGPIAFIESTTLTNIFEEDANRCLLLQTDERPEQTRRIFASIARSFGDQGGQAGVNTVIERHHAVQRLLSPVEVVIPFADTLVRLFRSERVEARRAFGHLLNGISACTLLHQFQRERTTDERLIALDVDYQIAARLLNQPLAQLLGSRLSPAVLRFWERLRSRLGLDVFQTRDAYRGESVSDRQVRDWLSVLRDRGVLDQVEAPKGPKPASWRLLPVDPADESGADLPTMDEVFGAVQFQHSNKAQVLVSVGVPPEPSRIAGAVPAMADAVLEPIRQSEPLPTNPSDEAGHLIAGKLEASGGGDES